MLRPFMGKPIIQKVFIHTCNQESRSRLTQLTSQGIRPAAEVKKRNARVWVTADLGILEKSLSVHQYHRLNCSTTGLFMLSNQTHLLDLAPYQQSQLNKQALSRANAVLQAQQEAAIDGILVVDEENRVVSYNRRFQELWQIPNLLITPGDDQPVLAHVVGQVADPEAFLAQVQYIYQHRDLISRDEILLADGRVFDRYSAPAQSPQGEYFGRVWYFRDITDRKQIEIALVQLNQDLTTRVQERTAKLQQSLEELQKTQTQMIQSEKMSALGGLVAGVAHEINNPVGFLAGNIQPALDYVRDMFDLIELYQTTFPQPGAAIADKIEEIDLPYIREDLPKLIGSMAEGINRIRHLSNSLRTFSRADHGCKTRFDIHDGIESTILILKHRLKANDQRPAIEVLKQYGDLPAIDCFPGQLNQVFMNILANAIDALEESNQGKSFQALQAHPNQILIHTAQVEDQIAIRIQDNGIGMAQETQQNIFNHLFTTKAVGKGTGLGLSIAHQIVVEKHRGSLTVQSERGQGTEFTILLPINDRAVAVDSP